MIEKLKPTITGFDEKPKMPNACEYLEKINELVDAVNSLRDDCNLLMGYIAPEDKCEPNLTDEDLRNMMKDPKYWRDNDPEIVRKVEQGFKKLYQKD